jgi:hypothetical protein
MRIARDLPRWIIGSVPVGRGIGINRFLGLFTFILLEAQPQYVLVGLGEAPLLTIQFFNEHPVLHA